MRILFCLLLGTMLAGAGAPPPIQYNQFSTNVPFAPVRGPVSFQTNVTVLRTNIANNLWVSNDVYLFQSGAPGDILTLDTGGKAIWQLNTGGNTNLGQFVAAGTNISIITNGVITTVSGVTDTNMVSIVASNNGPFIFRVNGIGTNTTLYQHGGFVTDGANWHQMPYWTNTGGIANLRVLRTTNTPGHLVNLMALRHVSAGNDALYLGDEGSAGMSAVTLQVGSTVEGNTNARITLSYGDWLQWRFLPKVIQGGAHDTGGGNDFDKPFIELDCSDPGDAPYFRGVYFGNTNAFAALVGTNFFFTNGVTHQVPFVISNNNSVYLKGQYLTMDNGNLIFDDQGATEADLIVGGSAGPPGNIFVRKGDGTTNVIISGDTGTGLFKDNVYVSNDIVLLHNQTNLVGNMYFADPSAVAGGIRSIQSYGLSSARYLTNMSWDVTSEDIGLGDSGMVGVIKTLIRLYVANGFQMPAGAGAGKVLTSDGAGVGTWQPATGGSAVTFNPNQFGGAAAGTNILVGAKLTNIVIQSSGGGVQVYPNSSLKFNIMQGDTNTSLISITNLNFTSGLLYSLSGAGDVPATILNENFIGDRKTSGTITATNGFSSRSNLFILMPTNSPSDGDLITATGTAGDTKWAAPAAGAANFVTNASTAQGTFYAGVDVGGVFSAASTGVIGTNQIHSTNMFQVAVPVGTPGVKRKIFEVETNGNVYVDGGLYFGRNGNNSDTGLRGVSSSEIVAAGLADALIGIRVDKLFASSSVESVGGYYLNTNASRYQIIDNQNNATFKTLNVTNASALQSTAVVGTNVIHGTNIFQVAVPSTGTTPDRKALEVTTDDKVFVGGPLTTGGSISNNGTWTSFAAQASFIHGGTRSANMTASHFSPNQDTLMDLGLPGTRWGWLKVANGVTNSTAANQTGHGYGTANLTTFANGARGLISGTETTLTESSATAILTCVLANSKYASFRVYATTHADDGSDFQSVGEELVVAAVNKGGTVTLTVSASSPIATAVSAGGSTLTTAWTATAASTTISIKNNAVSSLSQTTLKCKWRVDVDTDDTALAISPQ